jgi:uncharacterized membrane protein
MDSKSSPINNPSILEGFLVKVFVDNPYLDRFIGCHRLSDRSFFINNRQFHICARCTGLLIGMVLSLLLMPLNAYIGFLFPIFLVVLAIDGLTQKAKLRQSNNLLRFTTGLTTAATFASFFLYVPKFL